MYLEKTKRISLTLSEDLIQRIDDTRLYFVGTYQHERTRTSTIQDLLEYALYMHAMEDSGRLKRI